MDLHSDLPADPSGVAPTGTAPVPVAATMRRVHAELRAGGVPTFEALLALEG